MSYSGSPLASESMEEVNRAPRGEEEAIQAGEIKTSTSISPCEE